jgi:serum/glucocorticoid-regulated kinase 2
MDGKYKIPLEKYLYGDKANKVIDVSPKPIDPKKPEKVDIIFVDTDSSKPSDQVPTPKVVRLQDFVILKVIGRGSFGKVCLVEYTQNKELYAMKSLKKDVLLTQEQIENTLQEKKILTNIKHPFLVNLVFCFQTIDRIYFVMNFLRGGELFQCLRKFRVFDEEKFIKLIILGYDFMQLKSEWHLTIYTKILSYIET